jgi:acetylornithine deacetylase/succinyl-diaminopimelate desuccinylase-like protein
MAKKTGRKYKLNWNKINKEALDYFKAILKIDTTNPPGNELKAVQYLKRLFKTEGFRCTVIPTARNRACLITRLSSKTNHKAPLILASHLDVVPHDPEKWEFGAFAAEEKDGFIYGRGAVDMKNMTIMSLMTMLLLKRLGINLNREIIFVSTADEEAGAAYGMEYLIDKKPDLLMGAEYALNEIGAFTLHQNGKKIYPIETAEKGFLWINTELEGVPGHGSLPHEKNPIVHLSRLIDRIYKKRNKIKIDPSAALFIDAVSSTLPYPKAQIFKLLKNKKLGNFILNHLIPSGELRTYFNAILHDTISPNIIEGGDKVNVIPGKSRVYLDCRLLPGTDTQFFLAELHRIIEKCTNLVGNLDIIREGEAVTWNHDTELFQHLKNKIEQADPGSIVVPYLVSGYTDSKFLARLGITCYGFSPVQIPEGIKFTELFHGHNERIPVYGFLWGLKLLFETVREFTEIK